MWTQLKSILGEAYAAVVYGGKPTSTAWQPDTALREAVATQTQADIPEEQEPETPAYRWADDKDLRAAGAAFAPNADQDIQGSLFLGDLKEFYAAMDAFNATRPAERQFALKLREDIAEGLVPYLLSERTSLCGMAKLGGLALERNGRVFEGDYYSDMVMRSGFHFEHQGHTASFYCGEQSDFESFVTKLLNPPPAFPHPVPVRNA